VTEAAIEVVVNASSTEESSALIASEALTTEAEETISDLITFRIEVV
jgi:hypothetical protein